VARLGLSGRVRRRRAAWRGGGHAHNAAVHARQESFVPPFYRIFWFFHNVSLVATPMAFGMAITYLYKG